MKAAALAGFKGKYLILLGTPYFSMKLYKILIHEKYLAVAIVSAIAMLIVYPIFQSLGNVGTWITFIKPSNFLLYLVFSVLFGITLAVQYHSFKEKSKSCELKSVPSQAGSILGLFAFQCPACIPVLAQVLGLNTVVFLSVYKTPLILIGLALMFVSLHLLGAFKNE